MDAKDEIESLKQRIATDRRSGNDRDLRDAHMDLFAVYPRAALERNSARDYPGAHALLDDWQKILEHAQSELQEKQLLFGHSRFQSTAGYVAESEGLAGYFLEGNFVDAPALLQKAEMCHQRAMEFTQRVQFPPDAPPEAKAMRDNIAALQEAEMNRVKGMRLMIQGEYESEAGDLERAVELLRQSIATQQIAQRTEPKELPGGDPVAEIMGRGQREVSFIAFTEALLHKVLSDQALLAGKIGLAAREQSVRAEALQRCQAMHARAGTPLYEGFARRLARDVHIANARHDRLKVEAGKRPQWEWLKAVIFFVLAIGSVALLLWLASRREGQWLQQNMAVFTLLVFFVMAVAGVGAQVVKWKEAANWFRQTGGGKEGGE